MRALDPDARGYRHNARRGDSTYLGEVGIVRAMKRRGLVLCSGLLGNSQARTVSITSIQEHRRILS